MGNCSGSSTAQVSTADTEHNQTQNQITNKNEINPYLEHAKQEFEAKYSQPSKQTAKLEDFELGRTLGLGTFGRVQFAKYENRPVALKIMEKKIIVELQQVEHILSEKRILQAINFPFIVTFIHSFKDNAHLYLAFEFLSGGEMFVHHRNAKYFPENQICFYVAQVVLAFEYLHSLSIVYRNLKVEELLLTSDGYLKLVDFGLAKIVQDRTFTLCGTPEYLAPEIITGVGYNKSVDYWTLGILTYDLAAGHTPFQDEDMMKMYAKIIKGTYETPKQFSSNMTDLLEKLLQSRAKNRYGNLLNGVNDIKRHPWFSSINWNNLLQKSIKAPFIPTADKDYYESYQEEELTHVETELYPTVFDDF